MRKYVLQFVRVSKKGFENSFLFCLCYVGERKREKTNTKEKDIKKTENSVYWVAMNKIVFLLRWHFKEK